MRNRRTRPPRGEVDKAVLELLARHGSQILATARRYAATPEDAEDACQRGLEILLTKAPSTSEHELIPWLKTVVKHEAFALRRQRERHSPVTDDGELRDRPALTAVTHEQAERLERLRQGAEALGLLKPHEIRALVLRAEGFSYREICAMTGWSYTKVNRLLTEGRRAFLRRVSGIQLGSECARYEPLLSALADGEASAEDLARLRPHMLTCLSCRAALREFRTMPQRVASVVPAAALAVSDGEAPAAHAVEGVVGAAQRKLEAVLGTAQAKADAAIGAAHHKTAAMAERLHAAAELATGQKLAAVAASAAALAGGGTAIDEFANHGGRQPPAAVQPARATQAESPDPLEAAQPPPVVTEEPLPTLERALESNSAPSSAPPATPPPPPPDPANEFAPAPAAAPAPAPQSAPAPAAAGGFETASSGDSGYGSASGTGEFAP
jgi:RNA polymerase sigma factor (sigma-70 family)